MMIKFNWHHIILAVIIAVFFLMFLIFGTNLIYNVPEYGDFCEDGKVIPIRENLSEEEIIAEQEKYQECQEKYEANLKVYSNNLFLFTIIFVVIVVSIGLLLIKNEAVSGGLLLGSLMFLIWGTGNYWRYMDDIYRFIALGIGLGVLIYLGFRVGKKRVKRKK